MENMQSLLEFVQSKDIFICDFMIVVQVFQGKLYIMYYVIILSFKGDGFWSFCDMLEDDHHQIHMKWAIDYTKEKPHFATCLMWLKMSFAIILETLQLFWFPK